MDQAPLVPVKLWDLPIRVIHWSFVLLLPAMWLTHRLGKMEVHEKLGYIMLALLTFRIFWGFAGGSTARFSGFLKGPRNVLSYLRGVAAPGVGHNPLGGWSVMLLLGLILAQVASGLFAQDHDGDFSGPLSHYVAYDTADWAREVHELAFNLMLAAVTIHVLAILFYLAVKRDNLIRPMITGRRAMAAPETVPTFAPWWRASVGVVIALGLIWWVSVGAPL